MIPRKVKTFVRLLIRREFRCILHRISGTLPFNVFYYNRVAVLELEERKKFRRYGGATLRQATENDLAWLAECLGRTRSEFKKRWDRKDSCFLAEANGSAVSVTWVSFEKYQLNEVNYVFDPGGKGIFLYDAYTAPEWRLKGIHASVWEYLLDSLPDRSVEKVYCGVEHGNDLSLRTHLRFGFRVRQYITYVKVLCCKWHVVKTVSAGNKGVSIQR